MKRPNHWLVFARWLALVPPLFAVGNAVLVACAIDDSTGNAEQDTYGYYYQR